MEAPQFYKRVAFSKFPTHVIYRHQFFSGKSGMFKKSSEVYFKRVILAKLILDTPTCYKRETFSEVSYTWVVYAGLAFSGYSYVL